MINVISVICQSKINNIATEPINVNNEGKTLGAFSEMNKLMTFVSSVILLMS